jgi:endonuclease/exonuclease/phosphatase family metal-dependent hydrolase
VKALNAFLLAVLSFCAIGCRTVQTVALPPEKHIRVLTYNVNWGSPRPELAIEMIRNAKADIVCLQETTPHWEQTLRRALAREYPIMHFRSSKGRAGGGLAYLSRTVGREIAYIPSDTGWFDGWIMNFGTTIGQVQIVNVHLRPPVNDRGSWAIGYFSTRDDRLREMQRFFAHREHHSPTLVLGDFNDGEDSRVVHWLEKQQMVNALPLFDTKTPTWVWNVGVATLKRRMDHILFSPELRCYEARVISEGASDHFPVEAVFAPANF